MAAPADVIYINGAIHPAAAPGDPAEAMAVRNGRVCRVADTYEVEFLEGIETDRVDLGGRTVLPGFVDAAANLFESGRRLQDGPLTDAIADRPRMAIESDRHTAKPEAVRDRLRRALTHTLEQGVTTVFDTVTHPAIARGYYELAEKDELPLRVTVRYLQEPTASEQEATDAPAPLQALQTLGLGRGVGTGTLRIESVLIDAGSWDESALERFFQATVESGLGVAARASSPESLQSVLHALESKPVETPSLILDVVPSEDQIARLAGVGAAVVASPGLQTSEGSPFGRLLAAGVPIRFGSTGHPTHPLRAVARATDRTNSDRLGTTEALRVATDGFQSTAGQHSTAGSHYTADTQPGNRSQDHRPLQPGTPADFVVLSGSPWETPAADIDVDMTVVGGRIGYDGF